MARIKDQSDAIVNEVEQVVEKFAQYQVVAECFGFGGNVRRFAGEVVEYFEGIEDVPHFVGIGEPLK